MSLTLRREPFEFGILPASYLLPQIETPSGLVPIQQKLLAAAAQSQSRRDGRPSVTKEDIAQCLELPFATARVVIDTLISTLPEESTFLNVDGEDLLENGEETKTVLVTDLLLFLFVQTFTRPRAQSQLRESAGAEFFFATATDGTDSGWSDDEYGTGAHFSFGSPSASPARRRKKANEANASPGGSPRGDCLSATESSAASLHSLFVVHHFNTVCGLVVGDSSKIGTGGIRGGLTELTANEVDALGYLFRGHGETETDFKKTEKLSVLSGLFTGAGLVHELAATVPATALRNWVSSELVGGRMRASESATPTLARHSVSPKRTGAHGSGSGTSNSNQPKHDVSNHVIENVRKGTVVRRARDFSQKTSVRVADCEDTVVYLLAPAQHVSIVGCTDCVMVVGAAQRAVRVERCRGVTVIAATKRLRARNARECVFHLAVAEPIVFMGECGGSVVAPYNTFYNDLEKHLVMSNLETGGCTKWNELVEIPGGGGEESARDGDDAKKVRTGPFPNYRRLVFPRKTDTFLFYKQRKTKPPCSACPPNALRRSSCRSEAKRRIPTSQGTPRIRLLPTIQGIPRLTHK